MCTIKAICNADGKETEQQTAKKRSSGQQRNGAAGSKETEQQTAKKRSSGQQRNGAAGSRIRE
ncbi:MAG: hypothetical protein ACM677_10870 [Bacteroides sp.]